jgi:hypothetical protein
VIIEQEREVESGVIGLDVSFLRHRVVSILFFFGFCPAFSYCTERDTSYWESVIAAENLFVKGQSDSSAASYIAIFNRFGIPQLKCWLNAYHISEFDLNGKYSDTLTKLFQQKGSLFYLKKYAQYHHIDYLSGLRLDTIKKRDYRWYVKSSRKIHCSWRELERSDQRMRTVLSLKKMITRDSINRQKLVELYRSNNDRLPTKMEMMTFQQVEPYWVIFQHADFNLERRNMTMLDNILMSSLKSGRISPSNVKFHLGYTVFRTFSKIDNNPYKSDSEFLVDWFDIGHYNSYEEAANNIGISRLEYINKLRSMIYLEPITDDYLKKIKVFEKKGMYAR